ncbi:MAG: pilus assembly protein CpaB [Lachnospiraceae bacterium]|nr:pilus assembly protein CpaB [Lachnospiraceae bacterium]
MRLNNRFIYGIFSIILAAIIAFIAVPAVSKQTNGTCEVVRMKQMVARGMQITAEDVEVVTVGEYNLPGSVAKKETDVVGIYAAADLYPGDYILAEKVSSTPVSSDPMLNEIPDGKVVLSITTQTLATALSDKLQDGDIVRLYHYNEEEEEPVKDIPELRFIKVLSISDADGLDVDYTKPLNEDEEKQQTATITVLASPEQAMLLTRFENEGILHVALVSRGNAKLAEELLLRQEQVLEEIYGTPDEDTDPNEGEEEMSEDWTEDSFSEDKEDMAFEPESEKEELP